MGKRLLIVDDELILRTLICDMLSGAGYAVDMAENGMDALQKLNKDNYNLVISDIDMPQMDGITLYRRITEISEDLKKRFLFMTGNQSDDIKSFFEQNGCEYLTKPFKMSDLISRIDGALNREEETMAVKLICQNCNEPFYTASGMIPVACPHCGFVLNRRSEERFQWSAVCRLIESEKTNPAPSAPLIAKTQDISRKGIKIGYVGKPLAAGNTISIEIKDLKLRTQAKIAWSKALNELDSIAGLLLSEPMSLPPFLSATNI